MHIYQEQAQSTPQGGVPVTVFKLVGVLNGSSYRQVIERVEKACTAGTRNLLLDLSEISFMSSAGLAALHSIALLMRKERLSDHAGSSSLNPATLEATDRAGGIEKHIKLLNPQPGILKTLHQVEFDRIFEIYTNREAALAAFG